MIQIEDKYYQPTQTEFERLQTLPDGYTKMLPIKKAVFYIGNGWTVDVIAHIFQSLKNVLDNSSKTQGSENRTLTENEINKKQEVEEMESKEKYEREIEMLKEKIREKDKEIEKQKEEIKEIKNKMFDVLYEKMCS